MVFEKKVLHFSFGCSQNFIHKQEPYIPVLKQTELNVLHFDQRFATVYVKNYCLSRERNQVSSHRTFKGLTRRFICSQKKFILHFAFYSRRCRHRRRFIVNEAE